MSVRVYGAVDGDVASRWAFMPARYVSMSFSSCLPCAPAASMFLVCRSVTCLTSDGFGLKLYNPRIRSIACTPGRSIRPTMPL